MTDRVTKVSLVAQVSGYVAAVEQASKKTRELGTAAEKTAKQGEAFRTMGTVALAMGASAAAGLTLAVAKAADFDQAMSSVQAATHESSQNMNLLRQAAIDAGGATVFTATEAANAQEELAKAGVVTADIMGGGLKGSLDLAAAGTLGVGDAAELAATAMTQFGLSGKDVPHIADLLAAGAGKAQGSVQDMGMALKQAGLVANSTGLTIEETTGTLAAFASAGLVGSDAGTSLKSALQRLTPQSAEAEREMTRLGISAYDASGKFVGMAQFAGNLHDSLSGLTDEQRNASLSIIFGSDAVRAATVLYNQGADGVAGWIAKVNDSGYAAETARIKMDNLKGDIEKLGGAIDTALIQTGSAGNDVLRSMTQYATDLVDKYNAMPEPVKAVTLATVGLTAAVGLGTGAFLFAVPKIAAYRAALETLGPAAQRTSRAIGAIGKATTALVAVGVAHEFRMWAQEATGATMSVDKLRLKMKETQDAAAVVRDALGPKGLTTGGDQQSLNDLKALTTGLGQFKAEADNSWLGTVMEISSLGLASNSLGRMKDNMAALDATMAELVASGDTAEANMLFRELESRAKAAGLSTDELATLIPRYREAQLDANKSTDDASKKVQTMAEAVQGATERMHALADGVRDYDDVAAGMIDANIDLYQSIADADKLFGEDGFKRTLDITTQSGRDNSEALLAIARAANEATARTYETSGSQETMVAKLNEGRNALYQQARQFFDTDQQAWDYVNTLMKTPEQIQTEVKLNGVAQAKAELNALVTDYDGTQITMRALIQTYGDPGAAASAGFAGGGTVFGPGTSKSDSIWARLSAGEEVIQEPYASQNRSLLKAINSGQHMRTMAFAAGGTVNDYTRAPMPSTLYSAPHYAPAQPSVQVVMSDRPIYTDDGAFVGMIREIAGGQARLEIAGYDEAQVWAHKRGWAREYS